MVIEASISKKLIDWQEGEIVTKSRFAINKEQSGQALKT
jgi:hypothetical protein